MTNRIGFHRGLRHAIAAVWVASLPLGFSVVHASAQDRPSPAGEFAGGTLLFADDGIVSEGFVGGAARVYLSRRISIGPEVTFAKGQHHSHLIMTGNLSVDLVAPIAGKRRAATPFVIVGGGFFRTTENFPFLPSFSSTEGAFTVGGGVRVALGERVFAGGEGRVGWEAHFRFNALIGVHFGRDSRRP